MKLSRAPLRAAVAAAVIAGTAAAFAADSGPSPAPTTASAAANGTNANAQSWNASGKADPGPAYTVTLGNGALATVQQVGGMYTAKIQVKNQVIATLGSTHPTVTHDGVRYTLHPRDGKVGIAYLNTKHDKKHDKRQEEKRDGKRDTAGGKHRQGDKGTALDGRRTPKGGVAAGEAEESGGSPALIAGGAAAAAGLAGTGLLVARRRNGRS